MALIKPLVGEMSGSIGGLTYARNKGGQYVRQRSQVTNPNSPAQQAARSAMAYLAGYWLSTLTAAERTAWEDYAKNVSVTNRLGEKIYLSGQNMFIRSNAPRQRNSLAIVDAAPTEYILAELEPVGADMAGTAGGTSFDLTFDDSADWCSDDGAHQPASGAWRRRRGHTRRWRARPWPRHRGRGRSCVRPTAPRGV